MPVVRKGRVREAILLLLSSQPRSVTELSKQLGVAKSTTSYHVNTLLEEGLVIVTSVTPVRGNAVIKKYSALGSGDKAAEEITLRKLLERVERERFNWSGRAEDLRQFVVTTLFHCYRFLCNISHAEHGTLLKRVGKTVGKNEISRLVQGSSLKSVLNSLFDVLSHANVSAGVADYSRSEILVALSDFLDCYAFDRGISFFVEGLLSGVLESKFGTRYSISLVESVGSLGIYNFSIKRGK